MIKAALLALLLLAGPPAPSPSAVPNLPPPGPEEKAALDKIQEIKSKQATSPMEENNLKDQYADALTDYVTRFTESPRVPFALEAALQLFVSQGDVPRAEKLAQTFMEKTKVPEGKSLARRQLMQVYKFGGQADKAVSYALEQAAKDADSPDAQWYMYEAAGIQADRGQFEAAIKTLEDFIAAHPKHPAANKFRLRIADFMVSAGKAREALPQLAALTKELTDPEEKILAAYFTGVANLAASRQAPAEEAATLRKAALDALAPLQDAARKDPHAGQPYSGMAFTTAADVALAAGDIEKAGAVYDEMAKVFGEGPEAKYAKKAKEDLDRIGRPLDALEGPGLDGKTIKASDFRGKILLIDFFSAGFQGYPPVLSVEKKLEKKLAGQPFAILGVNLEPKEFKDAVRKFVTGLEIDWPVIADGGGGQGPLPTKFKISALPANILVDENGLVLRLGLFGPHLDDLVTQETARVKKGIPSVFKEHPRK